jgi:hypothetical protein
VSEDRRDLDDLAGLEDLPPDDPRVRALGPAARARLRAYRDFATPGDVPSGARVDDAERRLGEALERELGVSIGGEAERSSAAAAATGGPRRAGSFLDALLGPRLRPAVAIALVVIVAGGAWLSTTSRRGGEGPVMRGGSTTSPGVELTATARPLPDGALRLEWTPFPEATSYTLVFQSPDLTELARVPDVREPRFDLRAASLPSGLGSGGHVLWRVIAMRGADEIARSRSAEIATP